MAARRADTSVVSPGVDFLLIGAATLLLAVAAGTLVL